jgi:integrative and conjugative element protein (TIGR02256 family)
VVMSVHSNICQVSITEEVLVFLEGQAQASPNRETGGIIAGSGLAEDGTATVLKASDGGPGALHRRRFFSRDTSYCQRLVDGWALDSGGTIDYLGEWHKHLEDDPTPSRQDVTTLREIARSPDYHVRLPLLLIIGRDNLRTSLRAFAITVNGLCLSFNWTLWTGC